MYVVYVTPDRMDVARDYGCTDAYIVKKNDRSWVQVATFNNESEAKILADYLKGWYAQKTTR